LQNTAMVIAELLAAGELVSGAESAEIEPGRRPAAPARLQGTVLSRGLAIGDAVLHQPPIPLSGMLAQDSEAELTRLDEALEAMRHAIDRMIQESTESAATAGEPLDILHTYRMFAEDRGWIGRIREAIATGLTAEAAVQRVQNDTRARMGQIADRSLRERLHDIDDITNRLLQHLSGVAPWLTPESLPAKMVLVARSMGPAELLDYDRTRLKALVLEEGSPSSHVAIVARALDIPVIAQCHDALARIRPMDRLVVDASHGEVVLAPGPQLTEAVETALRVRDQRRLLYRGVRKLPAISRDGVPVRLEMNAGLMIDLAQLEETGAEGVGLYRTEISFMMADSMPDVAEQTDLYARVLAAAGDRPVAFRTLDAGGDKALPFMDERAQDNPALGWRAIRVGLDRPAMLAHQLRALVRATGGRKLKVIFPMVARVKELSAARRLLDAELARARREGRALPAAVQAGCMLEVPALLWQLPELLAEADFISLGTNDLAQYFYAADRGDSELAARYAPLAPAFLRAIGEVAARGRDAGVPVVACGEMASLPLGALALMGAGLEGLSVGPQAVGLIKTMICSTPLGDLRDFIGGALAGRERDLTPLLAQFARDHDIATEDIVFPG